MKGLKRDLKAGGDGSDGHVGHENRRGAIVGQEEGSGLSVWRIENEDCEDALWNLVLIYAGLHFLFKN